MTRIGISCVDFLRGQGAFTLGALCFLNSKCAGSLVPDEHSSFGHVAARPWRDVLLFCGCRAVLAGRGAGLRCDLCRSFPLGYAQKFTAELGKLKGPAGVRSTMRRLRDQAIEQMSALPGLLQSADVEMLVIDQLFFAGSTLGDHLRLPYVHVANALLANVNLLLPPISFPWGNGSNLLARFKNRVAHLTVNHLLRPICLATNDRRRTGNLRPYQRILNERFNAHAQICQQPLCFEFPRQDLPSNFYFVGPLHDNRARTKTPFPWERLDGRPIIYASMGTLQNGLEWVFREILKGCAGLDGQLVLSLGGNAANLPKIAAP